jgi:hypothetical protein
MPVKFSWLIFCFSAPASVVRDLLKFIAQVFSGSSLKGPFRFEAMLKSKPSTRYVLLSLHRLIIVFKGEPRILFVINYFRNTRSSGFIKAV